MNSANTARASMAETPLPNLTVWRFVDGKPGHERQTEGLLRALSEFVQLIVTVVPVSVRIFCWAPKLRKILKRREKFPALLTGAGHKTHLLMILCRLFTKAKSANLCYVSPTETAPNWMPKHLGRAAQTWVSPDGVSMIHEALTAGSRVRVFDLPWKKDSKWKSALEELAQDGWVFLHSQLNAESGGGGGGGGSPCRSLAPQVIVPNLKRRLSGVTATIVRLLPVQARLINIAAFGFGLPDALPRISLRQLLFPPQKPQNPWRIWHARRNTEMLLGLCLKHLLRQKFKLLFTSASQRVHTRYTRFLISKMDAVVAVSVKTQFYLRCPSTIIMHGIDADTFQPPANRAALRQKLGLPAAGLLIGCFGRIRHQKGTDVFVDAMLEAFPHFPNATAILLGRAAAQHIPYLRRLQQKIAQRGLTERILFLQEVPVRQTAQWYQALDLFIAPQRWEGFGLTPLEAMSCGVPVIASKVGAFQEIIQENQTGLLVAPGCAAELSQATKSALSNPDRLKIWSENARRRILKNFRLETEAQALNQLYRHLLNDQNAAKPPLENPS